MNSKSAEHTIRFQELVASFIEGSITEEQSRELLERVRADEALRREFAGQLQVDGVLRGSAATELHSLAESVLAGVSAGGGGPKEAPRRSMRWSAVFIRAAAVLIAAFAVMQYVTIGRTKRAAETASDAARSPAITDAVQHDAAARDVGKDAAQSPAAFTAPTGHDGEMRELLTTLDQSSLPAPGAGKPAGAAAASQLDAGMPVASPMMLKGYESRYNVRRQAASGARAGEKAAAEVFYDYRDEDIKIEAAPAEAPAASAPRIMPPPPRPPHTPSGESYAKIDENAFLNPAEKPLSTFSIDVDTASYSNLRRMLNSGHLPPADAVRIEEMINYFEYDYEGPGDDKPFSTALSMQRCPWNENHRLLRVGLQGRKIEDRERKPSNLVFLLDVSGSMNSHDKLPLLKTGMEMLVRALSENDRVAVVVYAGSSGLVLDSTSAAEKERIIEAIHRLSAGGSTAGGEGIQLAYRVAQDNFIKGGVNRVILATDGDFNVGVSSHDGLESLISEKRGSGIFLSVLGFGTGNLQDSKMELLANKGNGNYFYIDSEREAQKVLVRQLNATLVTIAKDVKIQVEFNPEHVRAYRLIGYENRRMAARDFDDDKKDAGEIGAGHQVTALYEIVPAGAPDAHDGVALKYGRNDEERAAPKSGEMLTVKLRYKEPEGDASRLLEFPYAARDIRDGVGDDSFRWAAAVAAFGQILRNSPHAGRFTLRDVRAMAAGAVGEDRHGYRAEFIRMIERAAALKGEEPPVNDKGYPLWQYRR